MVLVTDRDGNVVVQLFQSADYFHVGDVLTWDEQGDGQIYHHQAVVEKVIHHFSRMLVSKRLTLADTELVVRIDTLH